MGQLGLRAGSRCHFGQSRSSLPRRGLIGSVKSLDAAIAQGASITTATDDVVLANLVGSDTVTADVRRIEFRMPRPLKVYQAQIGFYDLIVAAPSQAAALRAWGTHLNMFADGSARIATDEQAIKAALAQPETPLKRGVGTNDPFSLNPRLPRFADLAPNEKKPAENRQPVRSKPKPPDRRALDDAEAALQRISDERRTQDSSYAKQYAELQDEEEQLRRRRAAIGAEEAATKRHLDAATSRAEEAVQRERQAFTRAGGDPGAN